MTKFKGDYCVKSMIKMCKNGTKMWQEWIDECIECNDKYISAIMIEQYSSMIGKLIIKKTHAVMNPCGRETWEWGDNF